MRVPAAIALTLMFLLSGAQKLVKLGGTQTRQFTDVFGLSEGLSKALVFGAGIVEVAAVLLILHFEMTKKKKKMARHAVAALAAFTILVTLLFKVYPKFKMIQALSNLSVFGGLLLYYKCLE